MGINCFYFTALSHSDGAIIYKVAVTYCVSVGSASCSLTGSAPPESHFPNPTGGINTTQQNKTKTRKFRAAQRGCLDVGARPQGGDAGDVGMDEGYADMKGINNNSHRLYMQLPE